MCIQINKDTINFLVVKYVAGLCFVDIKDVAFVMFVVSQYKIAPPV